MEVIHEYIPGDVSHPLYGEYELLKSVHLSGLPMLRDPSYHPIALLNKSF